MGSEPSKRRILFIGPCDRGGISTVNQQVMQLVEASGRFECSLINTTPWREIKVTPSRALNKFMGYLALYGITAWSVVKRPPHTVYLQISQTGYFHQSLFLLIAKLAGCRTLAHFHAMPSPSRTMSRRSFRLFLRSQSYIDDLVVLAEQSKAEVGTLGWRKPVHVIPNFVDGTPYPSGLKPLSEREYILYLGRMDQKKGIYSMLDLAARIPEERFVFIGGFAQKQAEDAFMRRASALQNVTWMGPIYGNEKLPYLQRAKCFVLPSETEVLPMTIIEASLCGTIPLATAEGLIPTLIQNDVNGFLIQASAPDQTADVIRRLLSDADRYDRISRRCQAEARARFSKAVVGPRVIAMLG